MAELSPEEAIARVRAIFGDRVTAKPVIALDDNLDPDSDADVVETLTRLCYFYPQYTLEMAEKLPNSAVQALLLQAEKQRAIELYNHTLIAAAPHTKKGKMVDKLLKQYKKIVEM